MNEFLFLLFSVSFVVTPLWSTAKNVYYQTIIFLGLISFGWFWAKFSSFSLKLNLPKKDFRFLILCFSISILLNFNPITNSICYLGDEIHHFIKPFMINKMVGAPILFFGTTILTITYFFLNRKVKSLTLYLSGLLILASGVFFTFFFQESLREVFEMYLVRFPFLPTLLSSISASIIGTFGSIYNEFSYRIIPLLSMILVGLICTIRFFESKSLLKKILVFTSIITVPSIHYYSSILYLEPLILLLTTVVLVNIKSLLSKNLKSRKVENLGWFCLLLLGFIKETVVPLIVGFLIVRGLKWIFNKEKNLRSFWEEMKIAFSLVLPLAIYLWFRGDVRGFNFDPSGVFDISIYKVFLITIWEQFGLVLPISVIGFIFLKTLGTWERIFIGMTTSMTFAFYLLDFGGIFIGYSRFNLFFLPFLLVIFCKVTFALKNDWVANIGLLIIIFSNLYASPINIDGSRNLYWEKCEDCVNMSADMVYPIHDALDWAAVTLKKEEYNIHVLKHRKYYYPYKEFYFKKYDWKPSNDIGIINSEYFKEQLDTIFENTGKKKQAVIVQPNKDWNLLEKDLPLEKIQIKEFKNQTLPIYIIFEK